MTNKVMKIDRVTSAVEAAELEALGADIIAADLDPDPRFADNRTVSVEQITEIRSALRHASLIVAIDLRNDPVHVVELARQSGAEVVQTIVGAGPSAAVRVALKDAGFGIVYAGIEISHDDDPGWVFGAHDDISDVNTYLFQVVVLPEYTESWAFLRDKSPEYPAEFQIEDLNALGRGRALTASLDLTPLNVDEIIDRLPEVQGLTITLGENPTRGDVQFHSFAEACAALRAIERTVPPFQGSQGS